MLIMCVRAFSSFEWEIFFFAAQLRERIKSIGGGTINSFDIVKQEMFELMMLEHELWRISLNYDATRQLTAVVNLVM